MKNFILLIATLLVLTTTAEAAHDRLLFGAPREAKIAVNNRIVANVNGKPISVVDVMKKMDMIFYREYPQYADAPEARYQYYRVNWLGFLNNLIDQELIIADAEENNLPLSNGDIRQEMEEMFGPNIHHNLENAGVAYDEAWDMLKGDLLLKRMMYVRVNSQVLKRITPHIVRSYYNEWAEKNRKEPTWSYHMLTVRADESKKSASTAYYAHYLLTKKGVPLDEIKEQLKCDEGVTLSVSDLLVHKENEIAKQNQEIIASLSCGSYSSPERQVSRRDNRAVYRIFFVKEYDAGGSPPYNEVAARLKNELLNKEMAVESEKYLQKLRKRHNLTEESLKEFIPEEFEPFVMY